MDSTYRPSFARQKRKISDVDSEEEEEEAYARPSFGFQGFAPASNRSPSPPTMASKPARPAWKNATNNGKSGGGGKSTPMVANSFAARMMAKMGYVEGQGLGTSGQGILNPVETVLRPQGVGLGAVKEKSQQAKDEAKREAARRGEVLEMSSDEERKLRKKLKERRQREGTSGGSGTSTPRGPAKPKYRTAREIEADAAGLAVPNVLKSLVDATGKEQKLLTSTAGLMTPMEFVNANEGEAWKIARRARHDLEAFADEWKGLSERKKFVELEEAQIVDEMDAQQSKLETITALTNAIEGLEITSLDEGLDKRWEEVTAKLEDIETTYQDLVDECQLPEVAVAAIHPLLKESLEDWAPLSNPGYLVSNFRRLHRFMSRTKKAHIETQKYRQSTTPYESMMYSLWLPRVRSALMNEWEVHDPGPATSLMEEWKDLLPGFVYSNILNQVIVPKLTAALKSWRPKSSKSNGSSQHFPWWLFDWLRYLDEHHTDPKAPTGLMSDAKRKFRVLLDTWDLGRGLIHKIEVWKEVLGSEFDKALQNHLLPRLGRHLREEFDVNPQDQDLTAFEDVMKWKPFFKPSVLGLLLSAEFFPKWHAILHLWLTSEPNYDEVGQWFSWWKSQIPDEINAIPEVAVEWNRGLEMMNLALDLGDKAKTDLPPPASSSSSHQKPSHHKHRDKHANGKPAKPQKVHIDEPSFKDIVEEWCGDEGLLMVPLREAHLQSGLPLFRITASANGKGGVLVYLKGDVVWAQNKKIKDTWEPAGLDAGLVARAEGN
ncbi:G-patch domain [Trichophyton interdigitale]|uniref:G-patch domain n=1 Tax=Trichophyton interdigitale TaxID=101480 RepID=A0A9P4YGZ7_9EURO|nr:G-patch domain [Trichophyton interdigitale]KAF3894077.1 G-patch domain [Trichophyton interdigitale]KAG8211108.1 G-patch domain [Trichophyton interdigitale]